jgi:hypothetical protein
MFPMAKMSDESAWAVRHLCGVTSRADLNTNKEAAERWRVLDDEFWMWQRYGERAA